MAFDARRQGVPRRREHFRFIIATVKACRVSFDDAQGVRHSVLVTAHSLYEAAALALRGFEGQPWTPAVAPLTPLRVEVSHVVTTHVVTARQVHQWATTPARSPAERLSKERVRRLLTQPDATRP